jgi:aspartate aminotransferase
MQEEGVALVPGSAFGDDRWVRLSYAASDRTIATGLDRLLRFIERQASVPAGSSQ